MSQQPYYDSKLKGQIRLAILKALAKNSLNFQEIANVISNFRTGNYRFEEVEFPIKRMIIALEKKGYLSVSEDLVLRLLDEVSKVIETGNKDHLIRFLGTGNLPTFDELKLKLAQGTVPGKRGRVKKPEQVVSISDYFEPIVLAYQSHGNITIEMHGVKLTTQRTLRIVFVHPKDADAQSGINWGNPKPITVNNGGFNSPVNFTREGILFIQTA